MANLAYTHLRPSIGHSGWQPIPQPGTGYLSNLGNQVKNMDAVHGMNRTLGKPPTVRQQGRMAQSSSHLDFNARTTLGPLAGRLTNAPYTRFLNVYG